MSTHRVRLFPPKRGRTKPRPGISSVRKTRVKNRKCAFSQASSIRRLCFHHQRTSVNSTFIGSPTTEPSGCLYPAYEMSCAFHTRKSCRPSVLCWNTVMADLKRYRKNDLKNTIDSVTRALGLCRMLCREIGVGHNYVVRCLWHKPQFTYCRKIQKKEYTLCKYSRNRFYFRL